MKHLSLLKKLGVFLGAATLVAPVSLTITSCSATDFKVDVIDNASFVNLNLQNMKQQNISFNSLLYGDKGHYNGNYVLFVGSNCTNATNLFFAADEGIRSRDQWYESNRLLTTTFYKAFVQANSDHQLKEFGIFNFIDFFDFKFYDKKGHEIYISENATVGQRMVITPFTTWTEGMIQQTKTYNQNADGKHPFPKYDWDETSVKKGDYVREDANAKAYRDFCARGLLLYPKKDKSFPKETGDDNKDICRVLIFKDGKIQSIDNLPDNTDAGVKAFKDKIVNNFSIDEKKEEKK